MKSKIELNQLVKKFGSFTAVDDLSLTIYEGETLGLLGPNGAGKTTTISMMIGLLEPTSGTATLGGESPLLPNTRMEIGLAPQALSLYEELTAKENLEFFASLYQITGTQLKERVKWALSFAGLEDRAKDRVGAYSGGMKRRLNLACAMIHEPRVVLMDEPTVGVDPQSRNHLFECIESLKEQGLTIIYTTHYMAEAQRLCDRVAIIDHGKLLAIDTIDSLIRQYGGDSLVLAELKKPLSGQVRLAGSVEQLNWRVETSDPMTEILQATKQGAEFQTLNVTQPDLESVFLSLTGRRLRD